MVGTGLLTPDIEVEYNHAEHRYYLGLRRYLSATQLLDHFKEKFDTKERALYMSDRYGQTPEYWIAKWAGDTRLGHERGNKEHNYQEQFLYTKGFTPVNGKSQLVYDLRSFRRSHIHYYKLPDGTYPELKLWRHDWAVAGRADKPTFETVGSIRYAHIEDYKTNKEIATRSSFGKKMSGPLSHLDDCEYNHYSIQLSIYQYILEYFGFAPGVRRVIHFPHAIEGIGTPDPVPYELPYLRDEVIGMLEYLKNTQILN